MADLGVPFDLVLDGSRLRADDFSPGRFVAFDAVLEVLDVAATLAAREDLGLLLTIRCSPDSLRPIARIMNTAETLGEALLDFASLQISNSSGAATYMHRQRRQLFVGYGVHDPALVCRRSSTNLLSRWDTGGSSS
jgi:hypothetical protein